jgi:hypothetical protein
MGETTTLECLKRFVLAVNSAFRDQYLRKPSVEDLQWILDDNSKRGFPGMIGSLDCMHWQWENCPYAWKGTFSGKERHPTLVLEAVCDRRLRIWHVFFGLAGSNNDINVLHRSTLLDRLLNGEHPAITFAVNGNDYSLPYYLVDGIYPEWAVFQSSISEPNGNKKSISPRCKRLLGKILNAALGCCKSGSVFFALHADYGREMPWKILCLPA